MGLYKVLVVEDDRSLAEVLAYNLRQVGYEVMLADSGNQGLGLAQSWLPQLVILDLMLPVIDGVEVCRRLRADAKTRDMLVLILTAKGEEADQLIGFALGADDYVTKPFSVKVLLGRIKALERRRVGMLDDHDVVASQGVTIDRRRHVAYYEEAPLQLTLSEFRLLETLVRQPGRAFSRNELIDSALGPDTMVIERTIDVHIRSLRQKLGAAAELVETVRGIGYRFRDPMLAAERHQVEPVM